MTAARLFHEQGYHATGVATIAREADVNPGSLYHFFPGKEQLLEATLHWRLENLRPIVTDPVEAASQDGIERVFGLLARYRQGLVLTGCRQGCPVGNLALELSDDHPAIRRLLEANFANWLDVVGGWIAAESARLPRGTDGRALAGLVLTVLEGGIMLARARASLGPFDQAIAQLRQYFDLMLAGRRGCRRQRK
jgi:AcrR family transcriptional regulator